MPPTLKQIAASAGVSVSTASIALGRPGRISDETRSRVCKIAEELGYRPNLLVEGLQTGRSRSIGLLMPFVDTFEAQMFRGIHAALAEASYVPVVLCRTGKSSEVEQLLSLIDRRVDGILVRPTADGMWQDHLHEVLNRNLPVVAIDSEIFSSDAPQIDFVGTDDEHGGRLAAEHLLSLGHGDFAVFTTTDGYPSPTFIRAQAFTKAVHEANGHCIIHQMTWKPNFDPYASILEFFESRETLPTAVFTTMDMIAKSIYQAADKLGISIPGELSVVGFADEPYSVVMQPGLTTLRQAPFQIGHAGAKLLLEAIDSSQQGAAQDEHERTCQRLQPKLVVRGSTAEI